MQDYLDKTKAREYSGIVDETVFNTALELFAEHGFSKKRISEIKIRDIYDSKDVKTEIVIKSKKGGERTTEKLKNILTPYILYLTNKYSAQSNAPSFPGYEGDSGQKKLQRHVKLYSNYRDLNELKKTSRNKLIKSMADAGKPLGDRVDQIAAVVGISSRMVKRSLGVPVERRERQCTETRDEVEKLLSSHDSKADWNTYIKILDEIFVFEKTIALDERKVEELIKKALLLIPQSYFKDKDGISGEQRYRDYVSEQRKYFINTIGDRIYEIENELIEEIQNNIHLKNGTAKSYVSMISNIIKNHPVTSAKAASLAVRTVRTVENIDQLLSYIVEVKKKIPPTKWQEWEKQRMEKEKRLLQEEKRQEKLIGKELKGKRKKEPRISYPKDTPKEKREKIHKHKISENQKTKLEFKRYLIIVKENAKEFASCGGLEKGIIVNLKIADIIRNPYITDVINGNAILIDWIVNEISSDKYKPEKATSLFTLSDEAKKILVREIELIKSIVNKYPTVVTGKKILNAELFPLKLKPPLPYYIPSKAKIQSKTKTKK